MIDTESDAGAWEEALMHSPCITQTEYSAHHSHGALPDETVPVPPSRGRLAGLGDAK